MLRFKHGEDNAIIVCATPHQDGPEKSLRGSSLPLLHVGEWAVYYPGTDDWQKRKERDRDSGSDILGNPVKKILVASKGFAYYGLGVDI